MINNQGIEVRKIYIAAGVIFVLTAWFSVGYNHFDEHFQVLEFAGLKLGLTVAANLPWEYDCMMRPALQPLVVYTIYKPLAAAGITNPFIIAFVIRLFSALLTFFSIHLLIRLYAPELGNRSMLYGFLLLSFFLWFVPYNAVRFSSETIAGRIFLIGFAWFFLRRKIRPSDHLMAGVIMGIAFVIRYQTAFMLIGFGAWLLFIRKTGFRGLLLYTSGILLATGLGVLADRWFYGQWVLTSWNYFFQNILLDKAAGFGVSPWWYYIEQTFLNAFPPLSLVYILAIFLYVYLFPKDVVTWIVVPFLIIHFIIPHKEIRFLFPVIGLLPVMIIKTADILLQKKGYDLIERRIPKICVKVFWYLNMLMLVVLIFRPADDHISLYKKLWNVYTGPAILYFTDEHPYHRAKVDVRFYKRTNLSFRQVDSIQLVMPQKDTVALFVTSKPAIPADIRFDAFPVYTSFPGWVRNFNINNWIERTSFWYVYELKPVAGKN